ncbi:hypothetical protein [Streptomyces sp. HNM0574]|uniref:hypothetical protein n=1 Tax=Streptomyces sp. HNM0574 TaxID=2714954 RepID=UPI00146EF89D|nr:hypothetical protein [Streptomyces sp. HNM0574]NLU68569.1 hypothetical protein [Streptomyces sp. HNM0574]
MAAEIRELPRLYGACEQILGGGKGHEVPSSTPRGPATGMPFNNAASEVRSAILSTLGSWSALVAEERRMPRPRRTVRDLAAHLERHHDWLCRHPAAGELSEEVSRLARWAFRVADPDPQRRIPVGTCVEVGCRGAMAAFVRPDAPGSMAEIRCDADPDHRWAGDEWMRLGHRMLHNRQAPPATSVAAAVAEVGTRAAAGRGEPRVAWLSAKDIAHLWRIAQGSVYRIAGEHAWRRRSRGGRTYYHGGDVSRSLQKRTPDPV